MSKINGICEALADYQKMVQSSIIGLGSKRNYSIVYKVVTYVADIISHNNIKTFWYMLLLWYNTVKPWKRRETAAETDGTWTEKGTTREEEGKGNVPSRSQSIDEGVAGWFQSISISPKHKPGYVRQAASARKWLLQKNRQPKKWFKTSRRRHTKGPEVKSKQEAGTNSHIYERV